MSNLEYGDEDEPPPLEDLSEEIAAALNLKTSLTSVTQSKSTDKSADISALSSDAKLAVETATVLSTSTPEQSVDIKSSAKSAASKQSMSSVSEFGGMNKGFLFGGGKNKSQNSKPKRQEELTVIKSRPENSSLKFDDVQKTQTETPAWITDSLLDTVSTDNSLMAKLSDPKYSKVLEEFQKDPKAAMAKYAHDKEVAEFFKSFMGIFGDHFSKMFPEQSTKDEMPEPLIQEIDSKGLTKAENTARKASSADERKMKEILSRDNVRQALDDKDVQKLIHLMRNDPEESQRLLFEKRKDSQFQSNIRILCENGLLQFQT